MKSIELIVVGFSICKAYRLINEQKGLEVISSSLRSPLKTYGLSSGYLRTMDRAKPENAAVAGLSDDIFFALDSIDLPSQIEFQKSADIFSSPSQHRKYGLSSDYKSYLQTKSLEEPQLFTHDSSLLYTPSIDQQKQFTTTKKSFERVSNTIASESDQLTEVNDEADEKQDYEVDSTVTTPSLSSQESMQSKDTPKSLPHLQNMDMEQQLVSLSEKELLESQQAFQNIGILQSSLSRSINKQIEAEDIIITEVERLRALLDEELTVVSNRATQLTHNEEILLKSKTSKTKQVEQAKSLIVQMTQIHEQIVEKSIRHEFYLALEKQQQLLLIEEDLLSTIESSLDSIRKDLIINQQQQSLLINKLAAFPDSNDRSRMLTFSLFQYHDGGFNVFLASDTGVDPVTSIIFVFM
jgi:hypothetical protein